MAKTAKQEFKQLVKDAAIKCSLCTIGRTKYVDPDVEKKVAAMEKRRKS